MRAVVAPCLATGTMVALAASTLSGLPGLYGAVLGTMLVVGFFGFGHVVLSVFRGASPGALMAVAMLSYLLQVIVLLAVFAAFQRHPSWAGIASPDVLGLTLLICTVVWTTGLVVASRFERIPLYDLGGDGA